MKRNYLPKGKDKRYDVYHDTIDRLMQQSQILNGGNMQPNICTIFFTKENIQALLYLMQGNDDGLCGPGLDAGAAKIPFVQMRLKEIEEQFKNYWKQQVLQGRSTPKEMPQNLLNEKLQFEAQLFVLNTEVAELNRRLKTFADSEYQKNVIKILNSKPEGRSVVQNGRIISVDYMPVKLNPDGILYIDCEQAPKYDGYSPSDYIENIVKPWGKACSEQAKKNKEKAIRDGVTYDKLSNGLRSGTNTPLPEMPSNCINYKKQVPEKSITENVKFIRTKKAIKK